MRAQHKALARRREQLRQAKQAQRERDRAAGMVLAQLKLAPATAERLRAALRLPGFEAKLARFLEGAVIDTAAYPNLAALCWNRRERFLPPEEALALYERNWRLVDEAALEPGERELIRRLAAEHGNGVLNA
jgi:hypothetical protein